MIKASAGGGGKGMRIAWNDEETRFVDTLMPQTQVLQNSVSVAEIERLMLMKRDESGGKVLKENPK